MTTNSATSASFVPRPEQADILEYTGGRLGISAVPGSGKTFTLSLLAAKLVERLASVESLDDREVLVVTFTNSAVENFRRRINQFVQEMGLLPGVGYRVRTLHGLAHDIVRERPGLVGLSEDFGILDERTAAEIKAEAVRHYLQSHPDIFGPFLKPEHLRNPRRIERYLFQDAVEIAEAVIRTAKELRASPETLEARLKQQSGSWPLLELGISVYSAYQRSLYVRGAIDFDDLILLALQALESDPGFLERMQRRWPYVLEDEAQDSSLLQEQMLGLLTAAHGNWVRVGDPNQAINTTFTSADPRYLRRFIQEPNTEFRPLSLSGRSALPIIQLANFLQRWSREAHPVLPPEMTLAPPEIQPTGPEDPQPNPPPGEPAVYIFDRALSPQQEVDVVVTSLERWLPRNPQRTVAVLTPDNFRGFTLTEALSKAQIPFDDTLLRSDNATRATAKALATVLLYLSRPQEPTHLPVLWKEVWWPRRGGVKGPQEGEESPAPSPEELPEPVQRLARALGKANQPERFVFPRPEDDWLDGLAWLDDFPGFREVVEAFRQDLRHWTAATVLPVDELVLTLGNELFTEPTDLALTHSIAVLLAKRSRENPHLRLPDLAQELNQIAQNKARILGFNEESLGFEPPPGVVTVSTMHSAKGLEWDRVYLMSVNSYSFPSGGDEDGYRGERWFVRDNLNLVAEAIEQVRQLHMGSLDDYRPGEASQQARLEIAAERLRLLYVGITRARQELILTYNTGRRPDREPISPALLFQVLLKYWKSGALEAEG